MKYLRPLDYSDLEWLMVERNRPRVMQWFRQSVPLTMEDQRKWFRTLYDKDRYFMIHKDEITLGYCALYKVDEYHKNAEFSIFTIGGNAGLFAMKELLSYGFNEMGLNRIYSDVIKGNRALEFYSKLGFRYEGTLRRMYFKGGEYKDSVVIGMTKEDYAGLGGGNGLDRKETVSNTERVGA